MKSKACFEMIGIGLWLATIFWGCSSADEFGFGLRDEEPETKSDIKIKAITRPDALSNNLTATAGSQTIDLMVASSPQFDTLIICEEDDPSACKDGALQYQRVKKIDQQRDRSFYHVKGLKVHLGMALSFAAFKASDPKSAEGRIVEVMEAGLFTLPVSRSSSGGSGGVKDQTGSPAPTHTFQNMTSLYRVWAPADNGAEKAHPLVVFFHGDTGSNFGPQFLAPEKIQAAFAAYGNQQLPTLDQARAEAKLDPKSMWNHFIFVAILSPTTNWSFFTWNTNLNNEQKNALADYSHNLLQAKILKEFNVNMEHVYLVGQSGGANFVSNTMVPRHSRNYQGGAIMLCGGEVPRQDLGFAPGTAMKSGYKFHFETSNQESPSLATTIVESHSAYKTLFGEAAVTYRKNGNGEHCFFSKADGSPLTQPQLLDEVIRKMLEDKKVASSSQTNTGPTPR